jgi:hypothetical protein
MITENALRVLVSSYLDGKGSRHSRGCSRGALCRRCQLEKVLIEFYRIAEAKASPILPGVLEQKYA